MDEERKRLFDGAVEAYERYRPGHAEAAFDDIAALTGIAPPARVLEIGCGPGQATLVLARRGYSVRAIELGPRLAERARERLRGFDVRVETGAFEEADIPEASCELVVGASSFHWIDRAKAYPKIASGLVERGGLALLWTGAPREDLPFRAELDAAYARHAPELSLREDAAAPILGIPAEIAATGLFGPVTTRIHSSRLDLTAADYLGLLGTYSDHIALPDERRTALLAAIGAVIERHGGMQLTMRTLLYVASKASGRRG